jgi:poly(3-hydroxybutyrate) depolymerase
MRPLSSPFLILILILILLYPAFSHASGKVLTVEYPPSTQPGELIFKSVYRLWIPDGVKQIRAVIVHQHGCGVGSWKTGLTAADDLHWQALAKKWDAALLGPSYQMGEKDNCRMWCDPRNGSEKTFLRALADFAKESNHPELEKVPWALWGHSGGGFWSSLMLTLHPERIAAIWFRSGSAFGAWTKGEIPMPTLTDAVYQVPLMFNGGLKEETDPKHGPARVNDRAMFKAWREHGAPAGIAPDPRTGHECGDSRYLAIPWIDACLALRLSGKEAPDVLLPLKKDAGYVAEHKKGGAFPEALLDKVAPASSWLPNPALVPAWEEYMITGTVSDTTPPPAPTNIRAKLIENTRDNEITWEAEADFESGLHQFIIERDGVEIGRVPEKPVGKYGRPLFQSMSYGDTPNAPLPEMRFVEKNAPVNIKAPVYHVRSVNSAGLISK